MTHTLQLDIPYVHSVSLIWPSRHILAVDELFQISAKIQIYIYPPRVAWPPRTPIHIVSQN